MNLRGVINKFGGSNVAPPSAYTVYHISLVPLVPGRFPSHPVSRSLVDYGWVLLCPRDSIPRTGFEPVTFWLRNARLTAEPSDLDIYPCYTDMWINGDVQQAFSSNETLWKFSFLKFPLKNVGFCPLDFQKRNTLKVFISQISPQESGFLSPRFFILGLFFLIFPQVSDGGR